MSEFRTCLLSVLGRLTLIKLVCKLFYLVTCFIVLRHRRPFRYVIIGCKETCLIIIIYRNQLMQRLFCILSRTCFAIFRELETLYWIFKYLSPDVLFAVGTFLFVINVIDTYDGVFLPEGP